jgi:Right handed beta helix region
VYGDASRRIRFKLKGSNIHLADFSIEGRLNYRNDNEPNDGIVGAGCSESTVSRIWIEHTKVGIWIYNGVNLMIEGCRFRDTLADGVNLCVGTSGTVIQDCSARGTGDDCFAIWPAPSDQGFVGNGPRTGHNVIRRCTGQLPFLANGAAVYGGEGNRVEGCLFTDITTGCGILISTTFPTSDKSLGIDNNFSGTTEVRGCELERCGGYDHSWAWRGSVQICLDHRSISGLLMSGLTVKDSLSSGITVVAAGAATGNGTLSATRLENVCVSNSGLGGSPSHDLWIGKGALGGMTVGGSSIPNVLNESVAFVLASK